MASCNPSFGTTSVAPATARNRVIVPRDRSARCQCARATARVTLLAQTGNEGNAEPSRPHAASLCANSGATSDEKNDQCQKAALRLGRSSPGRCPAVGKSVEDKRNARGSCSLPNHDRCASAPRIGRSPSRKEWKSSIGWDSNSHVPLENHRTHGCWRQTVGSAADKNDAPQLYR